MKITGQEQPFINQASKSKNAYEFQANNSDMSFDMLLSQIGNNDHQQNYSNDRLEKKREDAYLEKNISARESRQISRHKVENRNKKNDVRKEEKVQSKDDEKEVKEKKEVNTIDYDLLASLMPQDSLDLKDWMDALKGQIEAAGVELNPELKNDLIKFNQLMEQMAIDREIGNGIVIDDQMKMLQSFENLLKGVMDQMKDLGEVDQSANESQKQLMNHMNQLLELTDEIQKFVENNPNAEGLDEVISLVKQLDESGQLNITKNNKNSDNHLLLEQSESKVNYDEAEQKLQVLGLTNGKSNQQMSFSNQLSSQAGMMNSSENTNESMTNITLQSAIENAIELQSKPPLKQMVFNQIINEMTTSLKVDEHQSQMIMKLNPEALGKVELKIQMENGIIVAEMNVENETVKAAIESNLDDLRTALQDKGLEFESLDVNVNSQQQSNQQDAEMMYQSSMKRKISNKELTINDLVQQDHQELYNDGYDNNNKSTMNMVG